MAIKLQTGKFYRSRDGNIWCCYKNNGKTQKHAEFHCIRVLDSRIEYFYSDGRYDAAGEREHTLVAETTDFELRHN